MFWTALDWVHGSCITGSRLLLLYTTIWQTPDSVHTAITCYGLYHSTTLTVMPRSACSTLPLYRSSLVKVMSPQIPTSPHLSLIRFVVAAIFGPLSVLRILSRRCCRYRGPAGVSSITIILSRISPESDRVSSRTMNETKTEKNFSAVQRKER